MERHFDEELKELKEKVLKSAALAEEAIAKAVKSLVDRDAKLAEDVIKHDVPINMLEIEIDQLCMKLLALHQPAAEDLRFIASALRINTELERVGDEAVNIAERAAVLITKPLLKPLIDIPRMAQLAQRMLKDSIDAFITRNAGLARNVCKRDDEVDSLNDQLFRELLTYMMQDAKNIERALELILVARHLERIADHTTNISEDVVYIVEGKTIKHHIEEMERENKNA